MMIVMIVVIIMIIIITKCMYVQRTHTYRRTKISNHDDDDSQHHHIFEYKAMGPKKDPDPPDLEAVIGRVSDSLREDHL